MLLRKAVEWDVLNRMPCVIRLLPTPKPRVRFYDFAEYTRLLTAASEERDLQAALVVLLGGDAGLRRGEITALEWKDVDFDRRKICIQRSDWNGHVTAPKGGRLRYVPMPRRLAAALQQHRHFRGRRVLCTADGGSFDSEDGHGLRASCGSASRACRRGDSHPASYVLLAPGDAWGAGTRHSGVGWSPRHRNHATPNGHHDQATRELAAQ